MGEQLNLGEVDAAARHYCTEIAERSYGFVALCACGWQSSFCRTEAEATRRYNDHLVRTPAGTRLVETLRHTGRYSI